MIVLRRRSDGFGNYGNYRVFRGYGQGAIAGSIIEMIINYIEMGVDLATKVTELATDIKTMVQVKNDYEDAVDEAMDEGQSEREAKLSAKQSMIRGADAGTYTPVVEAKTPTWVYAAGAVVALGLVGGGVYWFTKKKR